MTTPARPRTSRCEIPDWFPALLAEAQRGLLDAETREAQRSAQRAQATIAATIADAVFAEVVAATATDRDALHHANARAVEARRRRATAQHRLATAPRRQRRSLRYDVELTLRQLERAEDYLERTRQRTAPAVEHHATAVADRRDAHEQLRSSDTVELLDAMLPSAAEHRRRVHALTTWQRWTQGHDLPDNALRSAFAVLAHQPGVERQLATALGHVVGRSRIDRNPQVARQVDPAGVPYPQHDLGIEL